MNTVPVDVSLFDPHRWGLVATEDEEGDRTRDSKSERKASLPMRKTKLSIAAGAISAPLLLGMAGVAGADGYEQSSATAGAQGASVGEVSTSSDFNGDGQVSYEENQYAAGPEGASSFSIESHAGDSDDGLLGLDGDDGLLGLNLR